MIFAKEIFRRRCHPIWFEENPRLHYLQRTPTRCQQLPKDLKT